MKKAANNKGTKTAKSATSTNRKRLVIIKPLTGDYTRGYTFALQTKSHLTLLGELELSELINATDRKRKQWIEDGKLLGKLNLLGKAAVKALDFPHILKLGAELAQELHYEPCEAIRMFAEGARKTCKPFDDSKAKMSALKSAVNKAATALLDALKTGAKPSKIKAAQAAYSDAISMADGYRDTHEDIVKNYEMTARNAVALLSMIDLRK